MVLTDVVNNFVSDDIPNITSYDEERIKEEYKNGCIGLIRTIKPHVNQEGYEAGFLTNFCHSTKLDKLAEDDVDENMLEYLARYTYPYVDEDDNEIVFNNLNTIEKKLIITMAAYITVHC